MIYDIMNKDEIIGKLLWNDKGRPIHITDIRLPYFIKQQGNNWIKERIPPKHRKHMKELLEQIGLNTFKDIIDYSKGLSLTDTFWIKPENINLEWKDINLFDNEFNDVISNVAFEGGLYQERFKTISPEFTTDGMLPKCWHRESTSNIITLKKGNGEHKYTTTPIQGQEPISEYLCSQILDILDYPHIEYKIEIFRNKIVSSCPLMTNQNISLAPASYFANDINSLIQFCEENNFLDDLYRIFIFDFIVYNTDRHLGNIGILYNSNSYELISPAPIYGNGFGLLPYYTIEKDYNQSITNIKNYLCMKDPCLYDDFDNGTLFFKNNLKKPHNIERLLDFKFSTHPLIVDSRLTFLSHFIQQRAKEFLNLQNNIGVNINNLTF